MVEGLWAWTTSRSLLCLRSSLSTSMQPSTPAFVASFALLVATMAVGLQSTNIATCLVANHTQGWHRHSSTLTVAIMVHSRSSGPCYAKTFEGGGNIIKLDVSKKHAVEKDTQASEAEHCA